MFHPRQPSSQQFHAVYAQILGTVFKQRPTNVWSDGEWQTHKQPFRQLGEELLENLSIITLIKASRKVNKSKITRITAQHAQSSSRENQNGRHLYVCFNKLRVENKHMMDILRSATILWKVMDGIPTVPS